MPTYEYRCKSCGEHLEVVQSFKDDPLTVCPTCEGELRKVFSPIGISFKGSGFYKTDSRSGSSAPKSSESKSSSDSKSSETKSSETKSSETKSSDSKSSPSETKSSGDSSSSSGKSESKAANAS